MKPIDSFTKKLGATLKLDKNLILEKKSRYYLINEKLREFIKKEDLFHAGAYIGKTKNDVFFPSFILLAMLAEEESNKVFVDKKAAWLSSP